MSVFDNNITSLLPQEVILKEIKTSLQANISVLISIPNDYPKTYNIVRTYIDNYMQQQLNSKFSKYFASVVIDIEKINPYYFRRICNQPCLHIIITGRKYLTPEEDTSILNPEREVLIDIKV